MIKTMRALNLLSAISFILSSASIWFIPFINIEERLNLLAYIVAAVFWIGLLVGALLQIFLTIKCRQLHLHSKGRIQRVLLAAAVLSFVVFAILVCIKSRSNIAVTGSLFCMILLLQAAVVMKRKGSLR